MHGTHLRTWVSHWVSHGCSHQTPNLLQSSLIVLPKLAGPVDSVVWAESRGTPHQHVLWAVPLDTLVTSARVSSPISHTVTGLEHSHPLWPGELCLCPSVWSPLSKQGVPPRCRPPRTSPAARSKQVLPTRVSGFSGLPAASKLTPSCKGDTRIAKEHVKNVRGKRAQKHDMTPLHHRWDG